jgi:hypothetical protein
MKVALMNINEELKLIVDYLKNEDGWNGQQVWV